MGIYNPDAPVILGEEWVGLRDEDLVFSRASNTFEQGHRFVLPAPRTLSTAQFYTASLPQGFVNGQVFQVSIYPATNEDESGPFRRVYVPVSAGTRSGGATVNAPATTVQQALANPSQAGVSFSNVSGDLVLYFDFTAYAQQLVNKRILAVNVIYAMRANGVDAYANGGLFLLLSGNTPGFYGVIDGEVGTTSLTTHRVPLGEMCLDWHNAGIVNDNIILPWTMAQFSRMVSTASFPITVEISGQSASATNAIVLQSVQLEIIYCEEQRVAYGACRYDTVLTPPSTFNLGANVLPMYAANTQVANPVLPAGVYSAVLSSPSLGDYTSGDSVVDVVPTVNAVRQYYTLLPHQGIKVNIPFPPWNNVGQTMTQDDPETVQILPQISLHASGGAVFPEVHVYGRRQAAPVYGTITATQGIDGEYAPTANFPQARFYARRFGSTVTPLTLSQGSFAATITPAQFDTLTEIVDGWKEVSVRLSSTPTGAQIGASPWVWSATGENIGNRWEILSVSAPAISGVPGGSTLTNAPTTLRLSAATYLAPTGSAEALTWQSPQVSGTANDVDTDAVLIFSQDSPIVSGIAVSTQSQAVTGLNTLCVVPATLPPSIPTAINYNQITWTPPVGIIIDYFGRTVASTWGNADVGGAWTTSGGAASDYSVGGGLGQQLLSTTNVARVATVGTSVNDVTVQALTTCSVAATGAAIESRLIARFVDASNYYFAETRFNTDGTVGLRIQKRSGGANTVLATASFVGTYTANSRFWCRFTVDGQQLTAWFWADGASQPSEPTLLTADSTLTAGTVGASSIAETGNLNTSPVVSFDNFTVSIPSIQYVEIQRSDTVDTTWYTVMRTTSQAVTGFNDYEARIGFQSAYRVRLVNMLGFAGTWSVTGGATITAPGVAGRNVDNSVLIFTTNARQSGASNMAYMQTWDNDYIEDLTFPEAGRNKLQWEYQRDYLSAFRPTERGGEQFTRNILVNNAAFATGPVVRGAFQSLRDLAWADVPYVCVRNELGDRWLANVTVPGGSLRRNRAIQVAQITVTEVTATPFAVDPGV